MDKFLLKICNKDTKTKWLRHSLSTFIVNLEWVSVQRTNNGSYATAFLNRVSILELLKGLIKNKNLCVLSEDKDSCVIIMNKQDCIQKLEDMLNEGIKRGRFEHSTDTTKQDLKTFRSFLHWNFKNHPSYGKIKPKSNQPARLYATTKTHKFNNLDEVTVENLKFRPIVDQTGTATYDDAKVIGEDLKPLSLNGYKINDCLKFPDMIKVLPPLHKNEEYVSYDVHSLFTNILLKQTIDYIIHKIYNKKFLKPICKKIIFKRLLYKLTTDCRIQFNQRFYKQIDGCTVGGPLPVILADINMVRTENEVAKSMKPPFYKRFVDDIYSKRNKSQQDVLSEALNNFHPKIKLTIEVNPIKFWGTKIILNNEVVVTTQVYGKENKKAVIWVSKIWKRYKLNTIWGDLHRSRKITSNFDIEIRAIKAKYNKPGYTRRFIESVIWDFITPLDKDKLFFIPPNMFAVNRPFLLIEIPYCEQNEIASKRFIKTFHQFTVTNLILLQNG